jgi:hypothetical protein
MYNINIQFEAESNGTIQIFLNECDQTDRVNNNIFIANNLAPHKTHYIEFKSNTKELITVKKLILDGIDTEYFIYHGFLPNSRRGNSSDSSIKYYFNLPIWDWFLNWKQNDNSTIRMLSKTHQGFIPL